ncbi:MAG: extracellular solute-binding protein [Proteobacteria bacterium]|nr:extracellular solute-binding protein [Pseudomonadota bacterium]MBI3496607.1 extracellular solute-binding protein [Pseudomonadota bacterium]
MALRKPYAAAILAIALALFMHGPATAQIGKQAPITIEINSSPWYAGFEAVVGRYEKETGNKVTLDVTPYNGMLEKARNAVRGSTSPYDLVNLDTQWTIEFYEGGFLKPLTEIEPGYALPPEVLTCGNSHYWNPQKRFRTPNGGQLMAVVPNCNTHVLVYRKDLFDQAGLAAPKTYDDLFAACRKLQKKPDLYGFITRGERGNGIRFDWMPFMLGYGAEIVADAENGDYTVTVNSPKALQALDTFKKLMVECGPANYASIGQADMIQLMASGKALTMQSVIAAWSNLEDPTKSAIVGKAAAAVDPAPVGGKPGVVIGNWNLAVPKNVPADRQKAAMTFLKWFVGKEAQRAYAEAGAIPVRADVLASDLAQNPKYRWMAAYNEGMKTAQQVLGYAEGAEVEQVLGLRLNQALIGELTPAAALNNAAKEISAIFTRTGRKTGMLAPLSE